MRTFEWSYVFKFALILSSYIPLTLLIFVCMVIFGLIFGSILFLIRYNKLFVLNSLSGVLVSYSRGMPAITQLFLIYYGLPQVLNFIHIDISDWNPIIFVVIAYGMNLGANVSENLRSAFNSVDVGQLEASYSLGINAWHTFRRVQFPQAIRVALPNFCNITVIALKSTSLAFSVGVVEIMTMAKQLGAASLHPFEVYICLSVIYYFLYLIIVIFFRMLEKKFSFKKGIE